MIVIFLQYKLKLVEKNIINFSTYSRTKPQIRRQASNWHKERNESKKKKEREKFTAQNFPDCALSSSW